MDGRLAHRESKIMRFSACTCAAVGVGGLLVRSADDSCAGGFSVLSGKDTGRDCSQPIPVVACTSVGADDAPFLEGASLCFQ